MRIARGDRGFQQLMLYGMAWILAYLFFAITAKGQTAIFDWVDDRTGISIEDWRAEFFKWLLENKE